VHERMPSSRRNGLWSTTLLPLDDPGPAAARVLIEPARDDQAGGGGGEVQPSGPAGVR
jgi:hypothetical protein